MHAHNHNPNYQVISRLGMGISVTVFIAPFLKQKRSACMVAIASKIARYKINKVILCVYCHIKIRNEGITHSLAAFGVCVFCNAQCTMHDTCTVIVMIKC